MNEKRTYKIQCDYWRLRNRDKLTNFQAALINVPGVHWDTIKINDCYYEIIFKFTGSEHQIKEFLTFLSKWDIQIVKIKKCWFTRN